MDKHHISITSCFDYSIPIIEQIKYISKVGFSHFSLGMYTQHSGIFDEDRLKKLKRTLIENKISIDTIHYSVTLEDDNWYEVMERTINSAIYLECSIIVVHCTEFIFDNKEYDKKLDKLKKRIYILEDLCKKYDIKIALENLCIGKPTEIIEELLKISNPEYIGFCYDSSHDQIDGPRPMKLLEEWKNRLLTVHISDRIKEFTDHVIPGEGFVQFYKIVSILKEIKFEYPLLMEVEKTFSRYKNTEEFLNNTYKVARKLENSIR